MKVIPLFTAAALAAGLAGCMSAGVAVNGHGAAVGVAYYDDAYGPYYGGYWGDDGYFYYYSDAARVKVVRDNDRHFRREAAERYHRIDVRERRQERRQNARQDERNDQRHEERREDNGRGN